MTPLSVLPSKAFKRGSKSADLLHESSSLKTMICPLTVLEKSVNCVCLKLYEPCMNLEAFEMKLQLAYLPVALGSLLWTDKDLRQSLYCTRGKIISVILASYAAEISSVYSCQFGIHFNSRREMQFVQLLWASLFQNTFRGTIV